MRMKNGQLTKSLINTRICLQSDYGINRQTVCKVSKARFVEDNHCKIIGEPTVGALFRL